MNKGLPLGDVVAEPGRETRDPALIGCEDLDGHILIEIDVADRRFLDREIALADRFGLDGRKVLFQEFDALSARRVAGCLAHRVRRCLRGD